MYGFSDQPNAIPLTRFSATLQGSSRYSARIPAQHRTYVRTVELGWRAPRRDPPADVPAPARDRPRPLLPAPGRGRLDARRHRARPPGRGGALAPLPGSTRRDQDRHHPLPPGPRRRRRGRAGADRGPRAPGRARLRAVRARLGHGRLVGAARRLPHRERPARRDRERAAARVGATFGPFIRFARDPEPLREGDEVAGWRVLELPGHADGHICLERDGVLVAGDHLLGAITPTVGLYPGLPARPARRLPPRWSGRSSSRRAWRFPGTAIHSKIRRNARERSSSTTIAGSTRPPPRSAGAAHRL